MSSVNVSLGSWARARFGLQLRKGIRAHDQDREHTRIGVQGVGEHLDEAPRFVPAFLVEQFLALIHGKNNGRRRRVSPESPGTCAMSRSAAKILASPSSVVSMNS